MVAIYRDRIFIKTPDIESFEWECNEITDTNVDFAKHISKDRRINKLKGFLYAYLLGANKSLSSEIITLKKYSKELQNILSAIITSSNGHTTYKQDEEITVLYKKINNIFCKIDGIEEILQNLIKQKNEQHKCVNFIEIIKEEGLYDIWVQKQNIKPSFQIKPFQLSHFNKNISTKKSSEYDNKKVEENQKYFNGYFSELEYAINKLTKSKTNRIIDLPILKYCSRIESIPADGTGFQPKLFNEYCSEKWNGEEFIASRLDFATAGGKLFKEELQEKWESNPSKSYINDLRKNLASHTSFVLNRVSNLTLQSFAAFCQKGESDIGKLEDYLISNEIGDFRIAFALWGIIFGFANMPKTLTNDLFLSNEPYYISEIYKYIFKQAHGIDLIGNFEKEQREKEIVPFLPKMNEQTKNAKEELETKQQTSEIEIEWREKLKRSKISHIEAIIEIGRKYDFIPSEGLFSDILKIKGIGPETVKKMKPVLFSNQQQASRQQMLTLDFGRPLIKKIYLDDNAWSYIEKLTYKNDLIKNTVKANLKKIQDGYKTNGFYHNRGDSKDNKAVIDHFLNWNISEKNQYYKLPKNDFPDELRDEIRKILESKYPS
jgi:hypothetical protein